MAKESYYGILGVSPDASADEIKSAYRRLAFEYHPDRNKDDLAAADRMKAVNEAYAVLSDKDKRRQYQDLYRQYGDGAQAHFRQTFSEQDIFKGSDIHQMFEEMARTFGLRGFDEIFRDFYGRGSMQFEFRQQGFSKTGGFAGPGQGPKLARNLPKGVAGLLLNKMLKKLTGAYIPRQGDNLHDTIAVTPDFARQGGPYAYHHRARDKKLVIHIPKGVRNEQQIRLTGMGRNGTLGADAGDLLLKVKIREPLLRKLKKSIGLKL